MYTCIYTSWHFVFVRVMVSSTQRLMQRAFYNAQPYKSVSANLLKDERTSSLFCSMQRTHTIIKMHEFIALFLLKHTQALSLLHSMCLFSYAQCTSPPRSCYLLCADKLTQICNSLHSNAHFPDIKVCRLTHLGICNKRIFNNKVTLIHVAINNLLYAKTQSCAWSI